MLGVAVGDGEGEDVLLEVAALVVGDSEVDHRLGVSRGQAKEGAVREGADRVLVVETFRGLEELVDLAVGVEE